MAFLLQKRWVLLPLDDINMIAMGRDFTGTVNQTEQITEVWQANGDVVAFFLITIILIALIIGVFLLLKNTLKKHLK